MFGVAYSEPFGAHCYQPAEDGKPAIINGAYRGGKLIDLAATSLQTRNTRTRLGMADALGEEWLELARAYALDAACGLRPSDHPDNGTVWVYSDPIKWLQQACRGVVVLDWRAAPSLFLDVPGAACSTLQLARRLDDALRRPAFFPKLFVPEELRRAA
jgi:hypothetical protein